MKIFLRILFFPISLFRLIIIVVISILVLLLLIIENILKRGKKTYPFWITLIWGKSILFILGFIIKHNSLPPAKEYLLMPNHRSYIDIFLMIAYSPSTFVTKAELLKWPVIGSALKYIKAITVQRNQMKSQMEAMEKIERSIKNGISITVFPEGTTSKGPGTLKFKNGTFKIAAELNIPIIPCAISYRDPNHAWVGDDLFVSHFFRQMWKPFSHAEVRFGKPITSNDFKVLKETTKETIEEMLRQIESNSPVNP